jgi:tRNA U55 pseudouridine synthase TruB
VKFKGKRAYNLVRSGKNIEIEEKRRSCEVFELKLLDFNLPYFDIGKPPTPVTILIILIRSEMLSRLLRPIPCTRYRNER